MDEELKALAREHIARTARWLARRAGWTAQDRPDLEQQLWSCLLTRQPQFDATRGSLPAFLTTVLRRCAVNLLRDRLALYRRTGYVYSLDQPHAGRITGVPDLAAVITRREYDARRRYEPAPDQDRRDLARDVAALLARQPVELRRVAQALVQARSKSEAARQLGVPRTTLNGYVRQLRQCFEQAGLRHYL